MSTQPIHSWILDSGGAGRGAWQGGVLYELMQWARENHCYPSVSMGASAGGYAAADVATETAQTVMKGWTQWGKHTFPTTGLLPQGAGNYAGFYRFRLHLIASIRYVMGPEEVTAVFNDRPGKKILIFATRVRRKDGGLISWPDTARLFLQSLSRKIPRPFKYLPRLYQYDPVVFADPLPDSLHSEFIRPLNPFNFHRVIEASCLVPLAMGYPMSPGEFRFPPQSPQGDHPEDMNALFIDGSFSLKMPMTLFRTDPRFQAVAAWARADKTIIFCCDPRGRLWETSSRLRCLNDDSMVQDDLRQNRLLVIYPDHPVEAGFLCQDNAPIMRTFERGQAQARRLIQTDSFRRWMED
ncbi:MAG: hypothetical protein U0V70_14965 [Terriglobia bacterium]